MSLNKRYSCFISICFVLLQVCFSQNETKKWYFGDMVGLDFNSNPPVTVFNGSMSAQNSSASMADGNGNLLFYTNGVTIWNASHVPMANGTGLFGSSNSVSQGVIILKKPSTNNIYYIFHVFDGYCVNCFAMATYYSIVDMSLAAGQGSVTAKNILLRTGPGFGKLTATNHCNGVDIWLVQKESGTPSSFKANLLSSAGINTTAVVSPGAIYFPGGLFFTEYPGAIKMSPNGKKIGIANYGNYWNTNQHFELYDFDNTTGVVSNPRALATQTASYELALSCEFSPDGTKFYGSGMISSSSTFYLYQWDLCGGSSAALAASMNTISSNPGGTYWSNAYLQLAPNGKIYQLGINTPTNTLLNVINAPNATGPACNFSSAVINTAPKTAFYSLPNFLSSYFLQRPPSLPFTYTVNSNYGCQTALFNTTQNCPAAGYTLVGVQWDFGDPASGINNTTTLLNPVHAFTNLGTYTVQQILYYPCGGGTDTLRQVITINQPCISVSVSVSCASLGSATVSSLIGAGPFSYTWMPTNQTGSVATGLTPGSYSVTVYDSGNNFTYTAQTVFTSSTPLTALVSNVSSVTCNGEGTGTGAIASITGGSGSQNYLWTNGSVSYTTASTTSLSAGTWSVNVTDALTGCQVNSVIAITQPPALTLNIAGSSTACVGSSISLTATTSGGTPGYTYTWTGGAATNTFSANQPAGNYVYTVNSSDVNNCSVSNTVSLGFIANPVISVSSVSICPAETGTLAGNGATSYTWNGVSTGSVFSASPPVSTIYTVIGSALTCTSSATGTITVLAVPVPTVNSIIPVCNGESFQLNALGGISYLWDGPQNFFSSVQNPSLTNVSINNDGVYNVTVTAANTCTAPASTTVIVNPTPTISVAAVTICANETLTLSVVSFTGSTFLWNGPASFTSSVQNPTVNNLSLQYTGSYTINVTSSSGCTNSAMANVLVNPTPTLTVSDVSICPLESGTLTVSGATSYTWNTNVGGNTFVDNPLISTQYTVLGSALGCISAATASIIVKPTPLPFTLSNSPQCENSTLNLSVYGGTAFAWSGPNGFSSSVQHPTLSPVSVNDAGVYNVTVTAVNGCTASTTATAVVHPTPTLTASGSTVCTIGTLSLLANAATGSTYQWEGPSSFTASSQNPFIVNPSLNASGDYTVMVTSSFGCTNMATAHGSVVAPASLTVSLIGTGSLCAQALNGSPNTITLTSGGVNTYTLITPNNLFVQNPTGPITSLTSIPPFSGTFGYATATVIGSNGICTNSTTAIFTIVPNPTVGINSYTPVICAGQSFTYTSFGANSYTWGPNTPGLSTYTSVVTVASPTVTSVYSVFGGSLGCNSPTKTSTLTVYPLPTVSISPYNPNICLNEGVILTALGNGTDFSWLPYEELNSTTGQQVIARPKTTKTYTVIASANNCTNSAATTVSVLPLPEPVFNISKKVICLNDTVQLSGEGGVSYEFKGPDNLYYQGQTVTVTVNNAVYAGTYTLTVTDKNGCKNSTYQTLNLTPFPDVSFKGGRDGCVPWCGNFSFSSSAASLTVGWKYEGQYIGGNNFKFCFDQTGIKTIKGYFYDAATGCRDEEDFYVTVHEKPKADFMFEPQTPVEGLDWVKFSNTSQGENIQQFNWHFINNKGYTTKIKHPEYLFENAGVYPVALVVRNQWGCMDTVVKTIRIEPDFTIYVPNVFTPNEDNKNETFLPVLRGEKLYTLQIFDRWGTKLFETRDPDQGWDGSYRGAFCKQDVYTWRIQVSSLDGHAREYTGHVTLYR